MRKDLLDHLVYSMALTLLLALFMHPINAAKVVLLIGLLKEVVWDKSMARGTPSWQDVAADAFGIALALAAIDLSTWSKT